MAKVNLEIEDSKTYEVKGVIDEHSSLSPQISQSLEEVTKEKGAFKSPDAYKSLYANAGKIQVQPYIDRNNENMGLERYDMAVFEGIKHTEDLAAIDRNGVVRYVTGLDEFSSEVMNIKDPELKKAVIYNIRCIVAHCEKMLATNELDPEDPDFWKKVQLLDPKNMDFWSKIHITVGNEPLVLQPDKDVFDLIKFMAIEAGGFSNIAKSAEDAAMSTRAKKFYLNKMNVTISNNTSSARLRNKALAKLEVLFEKYPAKLLFITKILSGNSMAYKNNTSYEVLYEACDNFINGAGTEKIKKRAAAQFLEIEQVPFAQLKFRAVIKDASFLQIIAPKSDGGLYHVASQTLLGSNAKDVLKFLENPLNEEMSTRIMSEVESYWNS